MVWVAGIYDLVVSTRLETARLVIRTFEARDAGPWLAMVSDPEAVSYTHLTLPTIYSV